MRRTRVAVIGVGALGSHHARIYSQIPSAKLVGVVDIRSERADRIAREFGCQSHGDWRDISDRVEAVSLAVPTPLHAEIGQRLLEQGVHVLVEKPIAHNRAGADALIGASRQSRAVLHVGHSERFNPAYAAVRPYAKRPRFFETHRMGVFVKRSLDVDVVLDLMIHDLDLVLELVESPLREIRAVGVAVLTPRVDIANARLEFEDGCVANLTASRVSAGRVRKFRFFQPSDYISIDFHKQSVEMFSLRRRGAQPQIERRKLEVEAREPLKQEIETFLAAIRGEDPPQGFAPCSGEQGKKALDLALEILAEMPPPKLEFPP